MNDWRGSRVVFTVAALKALGGLNALVGDFRKATVMIVDTAELRSMLLTMLNDRDGDGQPDGPRVV